VAIRTFLHRRGREDDKKAQGEDGGGWQVINRCGMGEEVE
jgi:hypothetical protein